MENAMHWRESGCRSQHSACENPTGLTCLCLLRLWRLRVQTQGRIHRVSTPAKKSIELQRLQWKLMTFWPGFPCTEFALPPSQSGSIKLAIRKNDKKSPRQTLKLIDIIVKITN